MKKTILEISIMFLLLLTMGAGCEKENSLTICGTSDPLTNLDWLRDLKIDLEEDISVTSSKIILYQLDDTDYIYVQNTINSSHDIPNTIFDCEGNEKYQCGGNQQVDNCSTFFSEAQKIRILWEKE